MADPSLFLPADDAYDLDRSLAVLTMGTGNPCLRHTPAAAEMTVATPDGFAVVRAERVVDGLRVVVDGAGEEWVRPRLAGLFGLTDDPCGFEPEGRLRRLATRGGVVWLPRLPTIFPRLVQVVLQQLITFRDACRGWRLLVQRYGEQVPGSGGLFTPPTAARLAGLESWRLAECDILPRHARVIQQLARQATGLERLWNTGQDADAIDRLTDYLLRQPGVGPWTVGYLRGAGLGDPDAVVLGDYGHPHHVAHFFTGAERSDDEEMLRLLAPYRPHRFRVLMLLIQNVPPPPRRGPKRPRLGRRMG